MSIFSDFHSSSRLPRILVAVLAILSFTLLLSYSRISSTTYSLLWPEPEPISLEPDDDLSTVFDGISPMSYGKTHRPPMKGMPDKLVADLPEQYIPSLDGRTKRLVIVGDVHGQKTALEKLLGKVHFDKTKDHLILTGDLVNKGPDSAGVVDLAIELGAHAVRGNHEDRVLYVSMAMNKDSESPQSMSDKVDLETKVYEKGHEEEKDDKDPKAAKEEYLANEALLDRGDKPEYQTARSLSKGQLEWLSQLPLILKIGRIPSNKDLPPAFENMVVVHAGLVPNVSLADQDPRAVMSMRTLVYPVDELRRDAVKRWLKEKAEKKNRGMVANSQIDEDEVDEFLQKIMEAQGLSSDHEGDDVAVPTDGREGSKWWKEWNRFQERLAKTTTTEAEVKAPAAAATSNDDNKPGDVDASKKNNKKDKKRRQQTAVEKELSGMTIVYGHDAKSGLTVPDTYGNGKGHTFGLDSGCVYGRKLSALVIEARPEGVVHGITQVKCEKAVEP
ncbi:calcineurin-like phosphoesterase [Diaporthe amygdali]|uniref:calcineurin-like phosphoesterase n=1 Tax=Phomopsis amygdali TaxID=1214568 RepID=UPI0022FE5F39|nr:calcineurin-like phosphoesterase [Diaporthe amygdali]KAJ0123159.1 calcineurin-like phosphoesterase [Diaporthe amygdali]